MCSSDLYGWTTPADTDLVKDGAAAIRTLGSSIDTSFAADEGDLLVGGTSNIFEALPIGAVGTVLTSDGDTAEWAAPAAGGKNYSLLNAGGTALTGATTITVSGITGIDSILIFVFEAGSGNAQSSMSVRLNSDSGTNYVRGGIFNTGGTVFGQGTLNTTGTIAGTSILVGRMSNTAASKVNGFVRLDGCNSSGVKILNAAGSAENQSADGLHQFVLGGVWNNSATVSSVSIISSTGNFDEGTIYIYGAA